MRDVAWTFSQFPNIVRATLTLISHLYYVDYFQHACKFYVAQFTVKIISHPDNSTSFEVIESQLENPLIDADHQDLHALKQLPLPGIHHRPYHRKNQTGDENDGESHD